MVLCWGALWDRLDDAFLICIEPEPPEAGLRQCVTRFCARGEKELRAVR